MVDALQHAISDRQPPLDLIHHGDRGGQYAGHEYRAVLRRAAMRQSMRRAANCYDTEVGAFLLRCDYGDTALATRLVGNDYDARRRRVACSRASIARVATISARMLSFESGT